MADERPNVVLEKRLPDGMHEVRRGPERALVVGVETGRPVWSMDELRWPS